MLLKELNASSKSAAIDASLHDAFFKRVSATVQKIAQAPS